MADSKDITNQYGVIVAKQYGGQLRILGKRGFLMSVREKGASGVLLLWLGLVICLFIINNPHYG